MIHKDFKNIEDKLPPASIPLLEDILQYFDDVSLVLAKPRKTKYGDYRVRQKSYQISVNNNLNPYKFLITLMHELAHHKSFLQYPKAPAHGKVWKNNFQELMLPLLHPDIFPEDILKPLSLYLKNPKASSDRDVNLSLALGIYDEKDNKSYIFELNFGDQFTLNNKTYSLREKKRSRFICIEKQSNKRYSIQSHAKVNKLNYE